MLRLQSPYGRSTSINQPAPSPHLENRRSHLNSSVTRKTAATPTPDHTSNSLIRKTPSRKHICDPENRIYTSASRSGQAPHASRHLRPSKLRQQLTTKLLVFNKKRLSPELTSKPPNCLSNRIPAGLPTTSPCLLRRTRRPRVRLLYIGPSCRLCRTLASRALMRSTVRLRTF